jgi:hypothetical protein
MLPLMSSTVFIGLSFVVRRLRHGRRPLQERENNMPDIPQSPIVPTHDAAMLLELQPESHAVRGDHDEVCLIASEGNRALSVIIISANVLFVLI